MIGCQESIFDFICKKLEETAEQWCFYMIRLQVSIGLISFHLYKIWILFLILEEQ